MEVIEVASAAVGGATLIAWLSFAICNGVDDFECINVHKWKWLFWGVISAALVTWPLVSA